MRHALGLAFLAFSGWALAQSAEVPRDWWKDPVSIQEIEHMDRLKRAKLVQEIPVHLDGQPITTSENEERIRMLERAGIQNNRDWQRIKGRFHPGDQIYKFAAPPLSGPMGFILVRDGRAIDILITGYQ